MIANASRTDEDALGKDAPSSRRSATSASRGRLRLLHETELDVTMIDHYASDEAVRKVARHRLHLVGSDGIFGEKPHPRLYGHGAALPRAVRDPRRARARRGSGRAPDRARRRPPRARRSRPDRAGKRADLVLLDPERYVDEGTYDDPMQHAGRRARRLGRGRGRLARRAANRRPPGRSRADSAARLMS